MAPSSRSRRKQGGGGGKRSARGGMAARDPDESQDATTNTDPTILYVQRTLAVTMAILFIICVHLFMQPPGAAQPPKTSPPKTSPPVGEGDDAIQILPDDFWDDLSPDAAQLHRQITIQSSAQAQYDLMSTLLQQLQSDTSIQPAKLQQLFGHYASIQPTHPGVLYLESMTYAGTSDEKITKLENAISVLDEQSPQAAKGQDQFKAVLLNALGLCYVERNKLHEAIEILKTAIQSDPTTPAAYSSMGGALRMLGKSNDALEILLEGEKKVVETHGPTHKPLHSIFQGLFFVYSDLGRADLAEPYIKRAIDLQPNPAYIDALAGLESADLWGQIKLCNEGLESDPDDMSLFCRRSELYTKVGEWDKLERDNDQLLKYQEEALSEKHQGRTGRSCLQPYHATYMNISAAMLRDTAKLFASREAAVAEGDVLPRLTRFDVEPAYVDGKQIRKLRIGYVSSDFNTHPVGRNMLGMFLAHSRARFELYAFATSVATGDPINVEIQKAAKYVDISDSVSVDHVALAKTIRDEYKIDILIDLNGWTKGRRLQIFAARPAPIQITHGLGFVGTSGCDAFDYFISDAIASPPRFDGYYTEKVIRMPHSYLPASHKNVHTTEFGSEFDPAKADKMDLRKDNNLPTDEDVFLFCSFQSVNKISREAFETWMRILQKAPNAVLWMTSVLDSTVRQNLLDRAKEFELDAERRIIFTNQLGTGAHLVRAQACDVHLDSWPYNAHSTAVDVLFAGVPLLVYLSDYHDPDSKAQVPKMSSRVSASLLHYFGMPHLIVDSVEAFEAKAVQLSSNRQEYEELRAELLAKWRNASLFDVISYTKYHERAYAAIFRLFYGGERLTSLDVPLFDTNGNAAPPPPPRNNEL